jgi:hypothetical protein
MLNGANTNSASFTAPSVSSDTQLKPSLIVKDDKGETSSPSAVTVTVKAPPPELTPPPETEQQKQQYSFVSMGFSRFRRWTVARSR